MAVPGQGRQSAGHILADQLVKAFEVFQRQYSTAQGIVHRVAAAQHDGHIRASVCHHRLHQARLDDGQVHADAGCRREIGVDQLLEHLRLISAGGDPHINDRIAFAGVANRLVVRSEGADQRPRLVCEVLPQAGGRTGNPAARRGEVDHIQLQTLLADHLHPGTDGDDIVPEGTQAAGDRAGTGHEALQLLGQTHQRGGFRTGVAGQRLHLLLHAAQLASQHRHAINQPGDGFLQEVIAVQVRGRTGYHDDPAVHGIQIVDHRIHPGHQHGHVAGGGRHREGMGSLGQVDGIGLVAAQRHCLPGHAVGEFRLRHLPEGHCTVYADIAVHQHTAQVILAEAEGQIVQSVCRRFKFPGDGLVRGGPVLAADGVELLGNRIRGRRHGVGAVRDRIKLGRGLVKRMLCLYGHGISALHHIGMGSAVIFVSRGFRCVVKAQGCDGHGFTDGRQGQRMVAGFQREKVVAVDIAVHIVEIAGLPGEDFLLRGAQIIAHVVLGKDSHRILIQTGQLELLRLGEGDFPINAQLVFRDIAHTGQGVVIDGQGIASSLCYREVPGDAALLVVPDKGLPAIDGLNAAAHAVCRFPCRTVQTNLSHRDGQRRVLLIIGGIAAAAPGEGIFILLCEGSRAGSQQKCSHHRTQDLLQAAAFVPHLGCSSRDE